MLTGKEYIRYSRQIMLKEHDEQGQKALKSATVLIIGLGGLGCPAAQYLTGAGIGCLILMDDDKIDATNLHRQILYSDEQVGQFKVDAAKDRLSSLNPHIDIQVVKQRACADNLEPVISQADVILDCSDNIETRYAINQEVFQARKILVIGSAIRYEAQIISFDFSGKHVSEENSRGCYQCLVPDMTDESFNCSTSGVMGPVLGIAGSMQALSAIKAITGVGFVHNLWQCFDGKTQQWVSMTHKGSSACPVCYKA